MFNAKYIYLVLGSFSLKASRLVELVEAGNLLGVEEFLSSQETNFDINSTSTWWDTDTPLQAALLSSHENALAITRRLLDADARVVLNGKRSVLMGVVSHSFTSACKQDDYEKKIRLLSEKEPGALDFQDARGRTALIETCRYRRIAFALALLACHADPNLESDEGETALDVLDAYLKGSRNPKQAKARVAPLLEALSRKGAEHSSSRSKGGGRVVLALIFVLLILGGLATYFFAWNEDKAMPEAPEQGDPSIQAEWVSEQVA